MTEIQRYLAEEVAEDHADGIITRREAMRRLTLLGVTGAAATAVLAAGAQEARPAARPRGDTITAWALVPAQEITWAGPRGTLMGAYAPAAKPRGGVLVIHENRGLNVHIRSVASRFAAAGYSALAIDLLSEEGGTGSFPDEAAVTAALNRVAPERFDEDMQSGVGELARRLRSRRLAAIGFCFGGGMVWRLLASGERRLKAAAPFYGFFPAGADLRRARAAVLAVYGGLDTRVNGSQPDAQAALKAARLRHELRTYEGADHAFFNDTNATRFHPAAMAEAYRNVLDWFDRYAADGDSDSD
jgi:carboxymethylenebutenolidase